MTAPFSSALIDQIIKGRCADFANLMGMHRVGSAELRVNVFLPGAQSVDVMSGNGKRVLVALQPVHGEGLFSGKFDGRKLLDYRLRVNSGSAVVLQDDPYRHRSLLDTADVQLFTEGRHEQAWQLLGAHPRTVDGVEGVHFVLWAPLALVRFVLTQPGRWDGRVHLMYQHADHGLWELFIPGLPADAHYKFEIMDTAMHTTVLGYDPFARQVEPPLALCSRVVAHDEHLWRDHFWQLQHSNQSGESIPMILHELAINEGVLVAGMHWQQLAGLLLPEIRQQGFTHVLLRDGGACAVRAASQRQPALLAAVPALGTHAAFRDFVELAHEQEIGVVWDISLQAILAAHGLPAQKPLALDLPALGGPLISIVLGCIGYWHQHLHIDGFRLRDLDLLLGMPVDVVSSKRGRRVATGDNPFAREWLGQLLTQIRARFPSLLLLAETEVVWPELTLPCSKGGFGFDYRLPAAPALVPNVASEAGLWLQRSVQSLQDANRLQQLLSLAPLADADPDLQQVVLLALWSLPGRKHLRLDCQLRVGSNWQPERGHDWEVEFATTLCEARKTLLRDMNFLYQGSPSLYEQDASHEGISVLHSSPTVLAFERIARHGSDAVLVVINTGETDCDDLRLRPTQVADYRLCCRGGRGIAGAQSLQLLRRGGIGELLVSVPACSAAVYSTAL